jgi:hypothetical protein
LGIDDKFTQRAFESFEKYTDFLMAEENKVNQKLAHRPQGAPATTTPNPTPPRPYYGHHTPRVNMVAQSDSPPEDNLEVTWRDEVEDEGEYEDDGTDGEMMVNAVRQGRDQGRPALRKGANNTQGRYTSGRTPLPALTVTYQNPAGQQVTMPANDAKLPFSFGSDPVWPTGFVFSPDMTPPAMTRMSNADCVLKAVQVMDPGLSAARTLTVFNRMRNPDTVNPHWNWCIIHGSTAHTTMDCPCVTQLCPKLKGFSKH